MRQPARRSRKIGLTQGGRVRDGRASEKWSRIFTRDVWKRLSENANEPLPVVLRENPSKNNYHPCRRAEYLAVLGQLPDELTKNVRAIVLRRTPRFDETFGIEARMRFQCVILNAFPKSNEMIWESRPTAASRRHYGRWCSGWSDENGVTTLRWTTEKIRRYYLFHLFLHEVGHINQPLFHSSRRREEFAENFALEWADRLGNLPPPVDR